MPRVVVAGTENYWKFAVIDFTIPAIPGAVLVDPGFGVGCRVAIDGPTAAVGSVLDGKVRLVDVSDPAAPVLQGTADTMLSGIGAIAVRGSRVAVGEYVNNFKARVKLIDFSSPMSPVVLGSALTPLVNVTVPNQEGLQPSAAIGSVAFLNDNVVFVSGPSDNIVLQVDFATKPPTVTSFNTKLSGGVSIDVDAATGTLAAGDNNGTQIRLFNAVTKALISTINTTLGGVISVAIRDPLALTGSPNDLVAVRVDFGSSKATSFNPGVLVGSSTTAIEGTMGACGADLGSAVALVDLAPTPPQVLGTADAGKTIAAISTLAMSNFVPAAVIAAPNPMDFFAVHVGSSHLQQLTITNPGGATLSVTNIASSDSHFTFSPAGPFAIPAKGSVQIGVTFAPTAEQSYNGKLTFNTTDPAHPQMSVGLFGVGALPHIEVVPDASLDLGSVPVCLSGTQSVSIHNTGGVPLAVGSITTGGPPYAVAPSSLTVAPKSSKPATVTFTPSALGAAQGMLTITSDDAAHPTIGVTLTGTGLPTPPPAISVSPPPLGFGAVPVQFFIGLRVTVANVGPCQPLHVTLDTGAAPYFVTAMDNPAVPPGATTLSDTIGGSGSKKYVVVFNPTALGDAPGTLTVTSDDPANPTVAVPLTGKGVQLSPAALELVLDRSGSMAGAAPGGTKMDALKAAVNLFANLTPIGQGDAMGAVEFDDAFDVLMPLLAYDGPQRAAIEAGAASLTPRHNTSIGGGLQLGQSELGGSALPRKVIVVFTDGMQNTPPNIETATPPITKAGTEVYAVGLGQPQNISSAALHALAVNSNGRFFQTDDTLILRKDFVQVLADAFRNKMAADPIFVLSAGETIKQTVNITECESRIGFILNWDDPASQLEMTVRAPDGSALTPASPFVNQLVRYGHGPGYRYYQIVFPPLDPGSGLTIGPAQIGVWTMSIHAVSVSGPAQRCTTSVVVESQLSLRGIVHATDTSSPIDVQALIIDRGAVVSDAEVVLTVTSPLKSLAEVSTPAVIAAALDADTHPIPAGTKPKIPTAQKTFPMKFSDGRRGFVVRLPAPGVDGVYHFEIRATGKGCGGIFDRFDARSHYIGRRPSRRQTQVSTAPGIGRSATVLVTPKDAQGRLLGPGLPHLVKVESKRATVFPVVDRRDGSYAFRVLWRERRPPALRLTVGDVAVPVRLPGPAVKARASRRPQRAGGR